MLGRKENNACQNSRKGTKPSCHTLGVRPCHSLANRGEMFWHRNRTDETSQPARRVDLGMLRSRKRSLLGSQVCERGPLDSSPEKMRCPDDWREEWKCLTLGVTRLCDTPVREMRQAYTSGGDETPRSLRRDPSVT